MAHSSTNNDARVEAARGLAVTQDRRVRALHVHSGNLYGGVEKMLTTGARLGQLVPALEASFALCFDGRFSEELEAAATIIHRLGPARVRDPLSVRRARRRLKELLRRERYDVVVTHSAWSQAIFGPIIRDVRIPSVTFLHGASERRHWLETWAERTPPQLVLCNSCYTAETTRELYPRARREVLYCPVAGPARSFDHVEIEAARKELNTSASEIVIMQASRMEGWKGQMLHLEALSRLKDVPGWVCWLVGGAQRESEREYYKELRRTAQRLGISERVRFTGERADVQRLLAAADIYCQPNTRPEPFGIAFIEALYAGLPVVTTRHGGPCEIVDQRCGLLAPPNDARALAQLLDQLISDAELRERLGVAGPVRAAELCDPATQMKRLHQLLASVLY